MVITGALGAAMSLAVIRMNAIAPGVFLTAPNRALMLEAGGALTERARKFIANTPVSASAKPKS